MDLKLKGKTVFISGSTAGIGFCTAQIFLKEGATVYVNGRTKSTVNQVVEQLKTISPDANVKGIAADFSDKEAVQSLIEQLPEIDILINNVGIYSSQSFFETTDEDWQGQYEVNVMSGVRLARHFLPKMLDKNWGRILFVSGLAQLTKGSGVTVNSVIPGSTMTEGAKQFLANLADKENKSIAQAEADFFRNIRTSSLLQRFAKVEEIANSIVYFSSPLAAATNGAAIKLEGGSMGGII